MKILLALSILLLPFWINGQNKGTITYQETVKFEIEIPEGMEEMFAKMPKERSIDRVLYFTDTEAMYMNNEDKIGDEEDHVNVQEGGFHLEMKMEAPDNRTYTNLQTGSVKQKQDLLGKTFLVQGEIEKYNWKIGSERQKVLDYICMKATAEIDDSTSVVAWFTTDLPISIGPGPYNGLPGLILALEYNEDERIIVATEIELGQVDTEKITEPKKGKNVSMKEFEEIRAKKMKEMNAKRGGANIHIITRH